MPQKHPHDPRAERQGLEKVRIVVLGPTDLRVEKDDVLVSVHAVEGSARGLEGYEHYLVSTYGPEGKAKGKRKGKGKGKQPGPPDPDDPYVVCFRDVRHFETPSGVRRARKIARKAARKDQQFGVVIKRAKVLPRETLAALEDVGRKAGMSEIPLYVKRAK